MKFLQVSCEMARQSDFLQQRRNTFTSIRSLKPGDEYYEHKDFLMKSALDWIRFHSILVDLWTLALQNDIPSSRPKIYKLREIITALQENNELAVEYGIYSENHYLRMCEKIKGEYECWNDLLEFGEDNGML